MTDLLIKIFVRNPDDTKSSAGRLSYGYLSGGIGIICNIFLFSIKCFIGYVSNSIAITVDAFNNLSDVASSIATIIGFKLTSKPPDKEHPFGHGRFEYIATLVIAAMVLYVGFNFLGTSTRRVLNPEKIEFSVIGIVVLVVSIVTKLWLALFNTNIGKKIDSNTMRAMALDSLSDVASTFVVGIAYILGGLNGIHIDGYLGIAISVFILFNGYKIVRETISPLLGEAPDPILVNKIHAMLLLYDGILGTHDLIIHSYGPGRCIATVHAEVSDKIGIIEAHDIIDKAEREISEALEIELVIHMDPINTTDDYVIEAREKLKFILEDINKELTFHDFRVVRGYSYTNLIFDLVIIHGFSKEEEKCIIDLIKKNIKKWNENYNCIITVDKSYN
ncbi:MAG: cation diffusion facilitator family transporter [Filifactoraceae bacterium]